MAEFGGTQHWGIRVAVREPNGAERLSRCVALADALEGQGCPVRFYIDDNQPFRPAAHRQLREWKPEPDPSDARVLLADIAAGEVEACIFDGDTFDEKSIERAANYVFSVAIDDAHRSTGAHAVVNPSLTADPSRYALPADRVLCGVEFAPLRRGLADARRAAERRLADGMVSGPADRLLVAFDTVQAIDATSMVLDALALIPQRGVVIVVLDSRAPHLDAVMRRVTSMEAVMAEIDVADLADYYQASDLIVGDGGTGMLERMCCGVPSVSLASTPEQLPEIVRAAAAGATVDGGTVQAQGKLTLAQCIAPLIADGDRRRDIAMAGLGLVDGCGAERTADALIELHRRLISD